MTARLKTALLAASFFGVLTGAAAADPATLVTDSNLRAGPGTQYPIQVTIPGGVTIDVQGCDGSWCVARYAGYEGYISQSLIAGGEPGPAIAVVPNDEYYDEPGYGYGYGYGPTYVPSYGYGYSGGPRRVVRPERSGERRGNWQATRGNWQGERGNRGNWQGNSGRSSGVAVQQRSQQNFRAATPRVNSQPTAGGDRVPGGGRAVRGSSSGQGQ